jgi:hypothetical protein
VRHSGTVSDGSRVDESRVPRAEAIDYSGRVTSGARSMKKVLQVPPVILVAAAGVYLFREPPRA